MVIIGIDPGATGGIAAIGPRQDFLYCSSMPKDDDDLFAVMRKMCRSNDGNAYIFIEEVHAMPKNGVVSMFRFGQEFGRVKMAAMAASETMDNVRSIGFVKPHKWQAALGLSKPTKDETHPQRKKRLLAASRNMFLAYKNEIDASTADAVLIAEYGRRIITGVQQYE